MYGTSVNVDSLGQSPESSALQCAPVFITAASILNRAISE